MYGANGTLIKLLAILFALAVGNLGAEIVQIGIGSLTNQSLPIESAASYSYTQQIYYATEIEYLGYVTAISLQYHVIGNLFAQNNNTWKVWLGLTERDYLDGWVPLDSLTLVWDGVLAADQFSGGLPGDGWLTIPLNEPFFYDSVSNLLLAVDENSPGSSSTGDEFLCSATSVQRGILHYSMTDNPDPAAPPLTDIWFRNSFPNLRLHMNVFSYIPGLPVPTDGATGVSSSTNLQWQSDAETFDLWLGTSPATLQLLSAGQAQSFWIPTEPWQTLQTYYWQVIAHSQGDDYPGPVWNFTIAGEGIGPPQNLSAYYVTDHVNLSWELPELGNPTLYRVYRNSLFLAALNSLTYQDFEVSPGQIHYYFVKAENQLGELSDPSNTVTVHIPDDIPDLILQEGFETCSAFSAEIPGWTILDLDSAPTWTWAMADFPGEGSPQGWISFFPNQITPPVAGLEPHSGAGMLASLSATQPPNDDWLISPQIHLGSGGTLSFWARSHTASYGLERLRALVSTTGADPAGFIPLSAEPWIQVPAQWTQYAFDLSAFSGQSVRLALQSVSWDAFALYVDDIAIQGQGGYVSVAEDIAPLPRFCVHPNPCSGNFEVSADDKAPFGISLYDLRGRKLLEADARGEFRSIEHLPGLASGVYLLRLYSNGRLVYRRLAVIK